MEYSNQSWEFVTELESAGHTVSKIKQKRSALWGLPKDFDESSEAITSAADDYFQAVRKVVGSKIFLKECKEMQ